MEGDAYPFPIQDLLPSDAPEEQVAAYEETVVRLFNSWIEGHGGSVHGLGGLLLSVDIDHQQPTSRLRFHYRSHAYGEFDAYGELGSGDPLWMVFSITSANWEDGSICADEDPWTVAIRRQKQAIADWRAAYPDAAAAVPRWRANGGDEHRAEWADWARRFPDAAARRAEAYRPVRDFVE